MTSPHHHLLRGQTISSSSSSSRSNSSSCSSAPQARTSDQVWNDITRSNPCYQHQHAAPVTTLQDFLNAGAAAPSDNLTMLQLRPPSSFDFGYHHLPLSEPGGPPTPANSAPANSPFPSDRLPIFPFSPNKRPSEDEGPDRRHKRMMKNRESAARSRARKQAYCNELEAAVNTLTQENALLRRKHDELRVAMAAQLPTKKTLLRTLSAPF